ncbi:hypothetical protein [Komagataeibacter xylinus]|nr:hypothetical protein [Komagataeibacter xylinus]
MVVKSILVGRNASHVSLDDWMPSVEHKRLVFDILMNARVKTDFHDEN